MTATRCDACGKSVIFAFVTAEGERWCYGCLKDVADIAERQSKRTRDIDAFLDRLKRK